MLEHTRDIEVFWGDCDAAGIVYYPRFYAWFDACAHAMFDAAGLDHRGLRERYSVVGLALAEASASFRSPATFGDVLEARSRVESLGRSRVTVEHVLSVGERVVVVGREVRVWASADPDDPLRLQTTPLPDEVRRVLSGGAL